MQSPGCFRSYSVLKVSSRLCLALGVDGEATLGDPFLEKMQRLGRSTSFVPSCDFPEGGALCGLMMHNRVVLQWLKLLRSLLLWLHIVVEDPFPQHYISFSFSSLYFNTTHSHIAIQTFLLSSLDRLRILDLSIWNLDVALFRRGRNQANTVLQVEAQNSARGNSDCTIFLFATCGAMEVRSFVFRVPRIFGFLMSFQTPSNHPIRPANSPNYDFWRGGGSYDELTRVQRT
jgi:hypothetical protein